MIYNIIPLSNIILIPRLGFEPIIKISASRHEGFYLTYKFKGEVITY